MAEKSDITKSVTVVVETRTKGKRKPVVKSVTMTVRAVNLSSNSTTKSLSEMAAKVFAAFDSPKK